mgnify:CR=1 FL=1
MSSNLQTKNNRMAFVVVGVVALMVGMSFAAVPLYDLFCRVTGYGGTTQVAEEEADMIGTREMTVRFNASTSRGMPWDFKPVQVKMELLTGQTGMAFFRATNPTDEPIVGTATFNVTPQKAGIYFNKIECFCFTEQRLAPGQSIDMPVQFFVDPDIEEDRNLREVKTITLSYTFFRKENDEGDPVRVSAVADTATERE